MARAAVAIVLVIAVGTVAAVLTRVESGGRMLPGENDPVHVRPLALRQDGRTVRLRATRCARCPVPLNDSGFDPARPFRLVFTSTTTVVVHAGVRRDGRFVRVGRWADGGQCIDSRCLHSLRFKAGPVGNGRRVRFPRRADTLRVMVRGEVADIRIAPKV